MASLNDIDTTTWGIASSLTTNLAKILANFGIIKALVGANGAVTVAQGGTGATDAAAARTALGAAGISQTITDGVTDKSPSENAVFDALAGKANAPITLAQTTTSGSMSIINTGIYPNTRIECEAFVYRIAVRGNPHNAGDGSYAAFSIGDIAIRTHYNGSAVVSGIEYIESINRPGGQGYALTVTAVFYNGSTETTTIPARDVTYQIRIKIDGYIGAVGAHQYVTMQQIL